MKRRHTVGARPPNQLGLASPSSPGATAVWVGSRPEPQTRVKVKPGRQNSEGTYVVTSVRASSGSESSPPGSGSSIAVTSPDSADGSLRFASSDTRSCGGVPFSPVSPRPNGAPQYLPQYLPQPDPTHVPLAGNTSNLLGSGRYTDDAPNNNYSSGSVYAGGTFLPTATSSMAALNHHPDTDTAAAKASLLQQRLDPDVLAASLTETLTLAGQGQPLGVVPVPELSPPYVGQPLDLLSAAVAVNHALLTSTTGLQPLPTSTPALNLVTPLSPATLMPMTLASPLLPLGSVSGFPPTLTDLSPTSNPIGGLGSPPFPLVSRPLGVAKSLAVTRSASLGVGDRHPLRTHPYTPPATSDHYDDQTTSGVGSSVPSSPSDSSPTSPHPDLYPMTSAPSDDTQAATLTVEPCYERPVDREACLRCGKKVYAMERVGPVKDVLYHKACFTCSACQSRLSLQTFHHSARDMNDLAVYCASHRPLAKGHTLDAKAVGIRQAIRVQRHDRVNDQIRGGPEASRNLHVGPDSVSIRAAMQAPAPDLQASIKQRQGAWFRQHRKSEAPPPPDVIRPADTRQYHGTRSLFNPG